MPEYKLYTNCLLQAMDYVYPRKSMKLNMATSGWVFEGWFLYFIPLFSPEIASSSFFIAF